ncbi:hypothetical protein [Nonomuraea dietziae]|uniref:hypothetical protein n=1 Tax=Nonomuraea dietziae TaxID=65515 RepID=UPI0031D3D885
MLSPKEGARWWRTYGAALDGESLRPAEVQVYADGLWPEPRLKAQFKHQSRVIKLGVPALRKIQTVNLRFKKQKRIKQKKKKKKERPTGQVDVKIETRLLEGTR